MAKANGRKKVRKPIDTIAPASEEEALFLERAMAYFREMKEAGKSAPYGKCLDVLDQFTFEQGRKLIRASLESVVQDQIEVLEKKTPALAEPLDATGDIQRKPSRQR